MNIPWRFTILYTDGVSCVKNFKLVCYGFLWCLWSDQSEFMVLNLWIGPGFIFESCS